MSTEKKIFSRPQKSNKTNHKYSHFKKKNSKNNFFKKKNIYSSSNKKKFRSFTTFYLHRNKKFRIGIFLKKPTLKSIVYPFNLNLNLINEYLKKK